MKAWKASLTALWKRPGAALMAMALAAPAAMALFTAHLILAARPQTLLAVGAGAWLAYACVLLPAGLQLFSDIAAGAPTARWFARGVRRLWWRVPLLLMALQAVAGVLLAAAGLPPLLLWSLSALGNPGPLADVPLALYALAAGALLFALAPLALALVAAAVRADKKRGFFHRARALVLGGYGSLTGAFALALVLLLAVAGAGAALYALAAGRPAATILPAVPLWYGGLLGLWMGLPAGGLLGCALGHPAAR